MLHLTFKNILFNYSFSIWLIEIPKCSLCNIYNRSFLLFLLGLVHVFPPLCFTTSGNKLFIYCLRFYWSIELNNTFLSRIWKYTLRSNWQMVHNLFNKRGIHQRRDSHVIFRKQRCLWYSSISSTNIEWIFQKLFQSDVEYMSQLRPSFKRNSLTSSISQLSQRLSFFIRFPNNQAGNIELLISKVCLI